GEYKEALSWGRMKKVAGRQLMPVLGMPIPSTPPPPTAAEVFTPEVQAAFAATQGTGEADSHTVAKMMSFLTPGDHGTDLFDKTSADRAQWLHEYSENYAAALLDSAGKAGGQVDDDHVKLTDDTFAAAINLGDGHLPVTAAEFPGGEESGGLFDQLDTDDDGKIEASELPAVVAHEDEAETATPANDPAGDEAGSSSGSRGTTGGDSTTAAPEHQADPVPAPAPGPGTGDGSANAGSEAGTGD
ncbi:unnamed protein product, partial [Amoebophrya sp. A120]